MAHISVHDANYLRRTVLSHKQKVLALYKKVIRDVESTYMPDRFCSISLKFDFD